MSRQQRPSHLPSTPTEAANVEPTQAPSSPRLALLLPDNTVRFVELAEPVTNPGFPGGVLPRGGAANGAVYYLDFNSPGGGVKRVDVNGNVEVLDFIRNQNYGLGVWAGDTPRLGWGTFPDVSASPIKAQIWVSSGDGSGAKVAYEAEMKPEVPSHLVFERWAADGQSFYFSQEPWGVGGYILLAGASKLVWAGEAGGFYTVIGWLNDEVLLVQWNGVLDPSQASVWVVLASGADGYKLADGTFLALVR